MTSQGRSTSSEPRYFGAPGHCYSIDGDWGMTPAPARTTTGGTTSPAAAS